MYTRRSVWQADLGHVISRRSNRNLTSHPPSVPFFSSLRVRSNIRPELFEFGLAERPAPRRHLAFAIQDELVEARPLLGGELAQIEARAGSLELLAVASHAMFFVELRARLDLILRRRDRAESCERTCGGADAECLVHHECPRVGGGPHAAAAGFAGCVRPWTGFQSSLARPSVGRKNKRYQREAIMVRASLFAAALVSMLATPLGAQTGDFKPVTREMLANPSPGDWLMLNRTYDEQRFSPLKEINRDTVAAL